MTDDESRLVDAVGELAPRVLRTLAMLELAQRHLHPPNLPTLAEELAPLAGELSEAVLAFARHDWPPHLHEFRDRLAEAATLAAGACSGVQEAGTDASDFIAVLRALRRQVRSLEALYPLAQALPPVSRFFLERDLPAATARTLVERIDAAAEAGGRGVLHSDNGREARGGFSLYVPEWVPPEQPMPLIVALHGGSGHGRDFLWSWVREARTRGAMVLAPTSPDRTWSFAELGGEDSDHERIKQVIDELADQFPVDRSRMLLTGMSDGGSYALLTGLREQSPYAALAPFSAVLSPEVQLDGRIDNARDLPIFMVHGALDWMFDLERARDGVRQLEAAGATVEYRELDDLSHTYAREQNPALLDWFGVPQPAIG
jgi:phospholipase/carboxylesterase